MSIRLHDVLYEGSNEWQSECDRCGAQPFYTWTGTKEDFESELIDDKWCIKNRGNKSSCICPVCAELLSAWGNTKARIDFYVADHELNSEETAQANKDIKMIEKELRLQGR